MAIYPSNPHGQATSETAAAGTCVQCAFRASRALKKVSTRALNKEQSLDTQDCPAQLPHASKRVPKQDLQKMQPSCSKTWSAQSALGLRAPATPGGVTTAAVSAAATPGALGTMLGEDYDPRKEDRAAYDERLERPSEVAGALKFFGAGMGAGVNVPGLTSHPHPWYGRQS